MEPSRLSRSGGFGPSWSAGLTAIRASEWWDYKLVPILAAFYATAAMLGTPIARLWPSVALLLASMLAGAAYVSLINDLTDIAEDRAAGKFNRLAGRSRALCTIALMAPICAGIAFLYLWRDDPVLVAAYAGAWIAFSLYSLPPVRLKVRGLAGAIADASGAHLFPTLVAMLLAFRGAGQTPDPVWLAAGSAWAFGYGLRGIFWHQLSDLAHDHRAGVRTFAQRHPRAVTNRLGKWFAFPLELAGLSVLLWELGSPIPVVLLGLYLMMARLRVLRWEMNAILVEPAPRYFMLMHEYYDAFLPIGILLASSLRYPLDLTILALHLLLFSRRPIEAADVARRLAWEELGRRLQRR